MNIYMFYKKNIDLNYIYYNNNVEIFIIIFISRINNINYII